MNLLWLTHLAALGVSLALGGVVFWTNPRRATNQFFLLLTLVASAWIGVLLAAFTSTTTVSATYWAGMATAVGGMAPLVFNYIRASIVHPQENCRQIVQRSPWWLLTTVAVFGLCQTRFFLRGVVLPVPGEHASVIPEPVYGPGMVLYSAFWVGCLVRLVKDLVRDVRRSLGMPRVELQFVLLGGGIGLTVGATLTVFLPLILGSYQSVQWSAPLALVCLDAIIAYGIATRHIMDVGYVIRLVVAYVLLTCYLLGLYYVVWWPTNFLVGVVGFPWPAAPHLLAALVTAFSLAPAQGWMQHFTRRLFMHVPAVDVGLVIRSADELLRSVSTVRRLLSRFAEVVTQTLGTEQVVILRADEAGFVQCHPEAAEPELCGLGFDDPLVRAVRQAEGPLVAAVARRRRMTPLMREACQRLERLGMEVALGVASGEGTEHIVLLGPRLFRRIYGAVEQQALQLLSRQLAVALHNARLYTQVEDGKIYNEVLLDHLVSGVIAVDAAGRITVLNREASRITGLEPALILGADVGVLPPPLGRLLFATLKQGLKLRDEEVMLRGEPDRETPLRVGSALFIGAAGKPLGAFLVFHDLTEVKKLEQQLRRADRLASLGMLSAGMAHEIKNPLVTIKTFTQLLPERYTDAEFRETFCSLVGLEVKRIDGLVNQLLRFARPSRAHLLPTHLHEVLDKALHLVQEQLRQGGITLEREFAAGRDLIRGDSDQLNQAFINFFLNAIEAMAGRTGTLAVATRLRTGGPADGSIEIRIRDTGAGIAPEHLPYVFDPFFTTKPHGTGLGLAVAHNIIQEHGGTVDVESRPNAGSVFLVTFPVLEETSTA